MCISCWAQGLQRGNTLFYVDIVWSGEERHINKYNVVWKVLRTTGEELGDSGKRVQRPPRLVMSLEGWNGDWWSASYPQGWGEVLMRMCAKQGLDAPGDVGPLVGMWMVEAHSGCHFREFESEGQVWGCDRRWGLNGMKEIIPQPRRCVSSNQKSVFRSWTFFFELKYYWLTILCFRCSKVIQLYSHYINMYFQCFSINSLFIRY